MRAETASFAEEIATLPHWSAPGRFETPTQPLLHQDDLAAELQQMEDGKLLWPAVRQLRQDAARQPLLLVAQDELPRLLRCATCGHAAVAAVALDALLEVADAGMTCRVALVAQPLLDSLIRDIPRAMPVCRRKGAKLLVALTGRPHPPAPNEEAACSKLRLAIFESALPTLLALGSRASATADGTEEYVAHALANLAAEPLLAVRLGQRSGGSALKLCCALAESLEAAVSTHAVAALSLCAEHAENCAPLLGFGALQPLLRAGALPEPRGASAAALRALRCLGYEGMWRNVDGVDPLLGRSRPIPPRTADPSRHGLGLALPLVSGDRAR